MATAGAVNLALPDGRRLRSHVLGIMLFDASSGQTALIAATKDTTGRLQQPNVLLYTNAFTELKADVRYTYTAAGLEQDIILREQPPAPEAYGLNPATTRLQVWTEFIEAPTPRSIDGGLRLPGGGELSDEALDFTTMRITRGRAFSLGAEAGDSDIPVGKRWLRVDGRTCLVEEVPLPEAREALDALPRHGTASARPAGEPVKHVVSAQCLLPPVPPAFKADEAGTPAIEFARADTTSPGFVLDYVILNSTLTNYTFAGNETYLVSGPVALAGTTTVEAGAVIKYAKNAGAKLTVAALACRTAPGKPAIFTASDDNSVGGTISGSTGSPSGYYANPALDFWNDSFPTSTRYWTLTNFRIAWAQQAIKASAWAFELRVEHGQIVHAAGGLDLPGQGETRLRNVLFADVGTALNNLAYANIAAEHVTFAGPVNYPYAGGLLAIVNSQYPTVTLALKNCVLARLNAFVVGGTATLSGEFNGFYQTPTPFGTGSVTPPPGVNPFLAQGAGKYYLAANSGFQDQGFATVDPGLAASLRARTTAPPEVHQSVTWSTDQTFSRRAIRDEDYLPDLGFHYATLDYIFADTWAAATVRLQDGVAVGVQGSVSSWGLRLADGGRLDCVGRSDAMNRILSFQHVQEEPPAMPGVGVSALSGNRWIIHQGGTDAGRRLAFRFTEFAVGQGGTTPLIYVPGGTAPVGEVTLRDCRIRGGDVYLPNLLVAGPCQVAWFNNVWERAWARMLYYSGANPPPRNQHATTLDCRNNLFRDSTVLLIYQAANGTPGVWEVRDNLFDGTVNALTTDAPGAAQLLRSHNGFTTNTVNNLGGTDNRTGLDRDYVAGPLGEYYYPDTGGANSLATLRDVGSRSSVAAGLGCHTTATSHVPDAGTVDIGYHYPLANQPPVAINVSVKACLNTALAITLQGSDPCGDWLDFALAAPTALGTVQQPFTRVDASTVTALYTPPQGFTGTDSFGFSVSDGVNPPAVGTVTINVSSTPAPVALNNVTVGVNTQSRPTSVDIRLKAEPYCSGALEFHIAPGQEPDHGTLSAITQVDATSARVTYTPQQDYEGPDLFKYYVTQGAWSSDEAQVSIYVVPPVSLTAVGACDSVGLEWTLPAYFGIPNYYHQWVKEFVIYRSTTPGGAYPGGSVIAVLPKEPGTGRLLFHFRDTSGLVPGQTYYYVVTYRYDDDTPYGPHEVASAEASASLQSVANSGALDVAFIVDNTGSMGEELLANLKGAIGSILNCLEAYSGNNYRLALVTPDEDQVHVRVDFDQNNRAAFEQALASASNADGGGWPESTDECLNTVVNHLSADARTDPDSCAPTNKVLQVGNCSQFRAQARKLVVLVTDDRPGGFCSLANHTAHAQLYAAQARTNNTGCIKINAIFVHRPDGGWDYDARFVMLTTYATGTCGWFTDVTHDGGDIAKAILNMIYEPGFCECQ